MQGSTIIAITDQPQKWATLTDQVKLESNFIIADNIQSKEIISQKNKTDLLIISQTEATNRALDIQSLSTFIGANYTLLVPPMHAYRFVNNDLASIARVCASSAAKTRLERPATSEIVSQASGATSLNGFLLGPFQLLLNGLAITGFTSKKYRSLFAYLLYHNRRPSFRETLMDLFWPDVSPDSARNSLNVAICSLRRMLKAYLPEKQEILLLQRDRYIFNPEVEVRVDIEEFLHHVKRGQRIELKDGITGAISDYEEAARLYNGDLMDDSLYDEWSCPEREKLRERYLYALDRLSEHFCEIEKYKVALHYCRRLLDKEACREDIHRRMMYCLYQTGHRDLAVKQYQKCEAIMLSRLDMLPGTQTRDLLKSIKQD